MMCTRRELELEPVYVCLRLPCHGPVRQWYLPALPLRDERDFHRDALLIVCT